MNLNNIIHHFLEPLITIISNVINYNFFIISCVNIVIESS